MTLTIDTRPLGWRHAGEEDGWSKPDSGPWTGRGQKNELQHSEHADGLVSLYARRLAETSSARQAAERRAQASVAAAPIPFGRTAMGSVPASRIDGNATLIDAVPTPSAVRAGRSRGRRCLKGGLSWPWAGLRRVVMAVLIAAIVFAAFGVDGRAQNRYRVKPGDTLESVAAEFGVDPEAILRSSWIANPPFLQPGEVIIIPQIGQTPSEAALMAAEREGTSPWVTAAHWVQPGDTIYSIADAYGVEAGVLIAFNELADPSYIEVGQRILIPASLDEISGAASTAAVPAAPGTGPSFPWVPTYLQSRNLSCEYAAAYIATSAFSAGVPESVFMNSIPRRLNPHLGYRGNIDGPWGGYEDYGIYPEPLVPILNAHGFVGEVFYTGGDPTRLQRHLAAGHPVIVWLAFWGDTRIIYEDDGAPYAVFAGMHVVVAYAYDEGGVYVSDPGRGEYRFFDWNTFLWMWSTIDGMSLAVYPM